MEEVSGGKGELLGKAVAGRFPDIGKRDEREAEELVFEKAANAAQHPDLAFENCGGAGGGFGEAELEPLVKLRVLSAAVDDAGADGVVGVGGEGELGVDVLVRVDADVVDVAGVVDVYVERAGGRCAAVGVRTEAEAGR